MTKEFDNAIAAAKANNEEALLAACHAIEAYFNFPKPNELVKKAEVPGGMYSNMVAQLKQVNSLEILEKSMELIPTVPPCCWSSSIGDSDQPDCGRPSSKLRYGPQGWQTDV